MSETETGAYILKQYATLLCDIANGILQAGTPDTEDSVCGMYDITGDVWQGVIKCFELFPEIVDQIDLENYGGAIKAMRAVCRRRANGA